MSYLLIGDLHLTDRPKDAYRFKIFDWVAKQQDIHKPKATFLMGDLTDQKDRHSSTLVNSIVFNLRKLQNVSLLMGNHDYTDPNNPFFGFLHFMKFRFVKEPSLFDGVGFIPHVRDEFSFRKACESLEGRGVQILLIHNSVEGSISEFGAQLSGFSTVSIKKIGATLGCFGGDIHKPQTVGPVTYVGSPYHIRFGDDFHPRCLLVHDNGRLTNLYFDEAPMKWKFTVREPDELVKPDIKVGDHVKIIVKVKREDAVKWSEKKAAVDAVCHRLGLRVFSITPELEIDRPAYVKGNKLALGKKEVFDAFCLSEDVPLNIAKIGKEFLDV